MKIKHIWSLLCKESVINRDDNNLSIYGILEELSVDIAPLNEVETPKKIGIPLNYEIVSLWYKGKNVETAEADIEYTLVDPSGNELVKNIQRMEIPKASKRFRSRLKIKGMPLSTEGDYYFYVKIKEEGMNVFHLVAELPLEVKMSVKKV